MESTLTYVALEDESTYTLNDSINHWFSFRVDTRVNKFDEITSENATKITA